MRCSISYTETEREPYYEASDIEVDSEIEFCEEGSEACCVSGFDLCDINFA